MHFGDGAGNVKYPTMSEMEHTTSQCLSGYLCKQWSNFLSLKPKSLLYINVTTFARFYALNSLTMQKLT